MKHSVHSPWYAGWTPNAPEERRTRRADCGTWPGYLAEPGRFSKDTRERRRRVGSTHPLQPATSPPSLPPWHGRQRLRPFEPVRIESTENWEPAPVQSSDDPAPAPESESGPSPFAALWTLAERETERAAFTALLESWFAPIPLTSQVSMCEQVGRAGLQCYQAQGAWRHPARA